MADRLPDVQVNMTADSSVVAVPAFPRYPCVVAKGESQILVTNERVQRNVLGNYGSVTSSVAAPYNLIPGETVIFNTETAGGPWTWTVAGTAGYNECANTDAVAWDIAQGETLKFKVDGGAEQTYTVVALTVTTAAALAAEINPQMIGGRAIVTGVAPNQKVKLISDTYGSASSVAITADTLGTATPPGFTAPSVGGTGDALNLAATTVTEAGAQIALLGGATKLAYSGGGTSILTVRTQTAGATGWVQCTGGTAQLKLGIDGIKHWGGSAVDAFLCNGATTAEVLSITRVGNAPGSTDYTVTTDYTLDTTGIDWTPGGSEPATGAYYYVTYKYKNLTPSFYEPQLYYTDSDMYTQRGGITLSGPGTVNHLVSGGALAFQSKPQGVYLVQLDPYGVLNATLNPAWVDADIPTSNERNLALQAAILVLEGVENCKLYLVPMHTDAFGASTMDAMLYAHAKIMSTPAYGQERTLIANQATGRTIAQIKAAAASYSDTRAIVSGPTTWSVSGLTGTYDSSFFNASLSGVLCAATIGQSVTSMQVPGVSTTIKYRKNELLSLVQSSVLPAQMDGDICRVIFALTTDGTSAINEEICVQEIVDFVAYGSRVYLTNTYLRPPAKIVDTTPSRVAAGEESFLDTLMQEPYVCIAGYKDIRGVQVTGEPRKIRITGKIKPVFPLDWIDLDFIVTSSLT